MSTSLPRSSGSLCLPIARLTSSAVIGSASRDGIPTNASSSSTAWVAEHNS